MILAALTVVTIIGMTEPAPDCRLVRERPFEGRSSISITDAERKMAQRAAEKGADTVHLEGKYCKQLPDWPCRPRDVRVARGFGYRCGP